MCARDWSGIDGTVATMFLTGIRNPSRQNQQTERPYLSAIPGKVSSFRTTCFTNKSGAAAELGAVVTVPYFC